MKLLPLLLKEDIYGENAIVFHRTTLKDLANKVYKDGFKVGSRYAGTDYGKGFYSTYDFNSQLKDYMRRMYGDIIVKFSCPTTNFFFCDWEEFKKTGLSKKLNATKDDFIFKQLDYYKIDYNERSIKNTIERSSTFTSSYIAGDIIDIKRAMRLIKGIIFTSPYEGKVLVSYDTKRIIPLAYTEDEGKTWIKVDMNLNYVKKALKAKHDPIKKIEKDSLEELLDKYDIRKYTIRNNGRVDVADHVYLNNKGFTEIPIKFGVVNGDFDVSDNNLTSFKNSPYRIDGDAYYSYNNIKNFSYAPKRIKGSFIFGYNNFKTLDGIPENVGNGYVYKPNPFKRNYEIPDFIEEPRQTKYGYDYGDDDDDDGW